VKLRVHRGHSLVPTEHDIGFTASPERQPLLAFVEHAKLLSAVASAIEQEGPARPLGVQHRL